MTTEQAALPAGNGSFGLIWTLVARSIGLTAGLGIGLLLVAALLS